MELLLLSMGQPPSGPPLPPPPSVTPRIRPLPRGIRGFDLGPSPAALASGDPWTYGHLNWPSEWLHFKKQIDLMAGVGANCTRLVGTVHAVGAGLIDRATYLDHHGQVIRYCQSVSKGMYCYGCAGGPPDYGDGSGGVLSDATIAAEVAAYCRYINVFPNVIGADIFTEAKGATAPSLGMNRLSTTTGNNPITASHLDTLLGACFDAAHVAAPGLSLSAAVYGDVFNDSFHYTYIWPHCDHIDCHDYLDPQVASDALPMVAILGGRQVIYGEYGPSDHSSAANETAQITAQSSCIFNPGARLESVGGLLWAAIISDGSGDYGAWTIGGAPRTGTLTPIAGFPRSTPFIPFPRRRRRA